MRTQNILFTLITLLLCGQIFASEVTIPPLVPDEVLGTVGYYRWRYDNFMTRHPQLSEPAPHFIPDYYLNYVEKYVLYLLRPFEVDAPNAAAARGTNLPLL